MMYPAHGFFEGRSPTDFFGDLYYYPEEENRSPRFNFIFPITDPDTLEDLEYAVRHDQKTRIKYINFLRRIKSRDEQLSGGNVFKRLCSDTAIFAHFCFSTPKFTGDGRRRRALKDFVIFGVCMLQAWSDHKDIDQRSLSSIMKRVFKRISVRNYVRLGRNQKTDVYRMAPS
ncbi:uncharacterized protein LOC131430433 [Malaya genurostris]|uniref:uncharacterized protein LOC131430433 n=1 Tax=Malaya genurostris TaxID=325434 RepID=UPI0026F37EF5|nr:uncharacterized protein LOC131430433 [Malaya genurostris]